VERDNEPNAADIRICDRCEGKLVGYRRGKLLDLPRRLGGYWRYTDGLGYREQCSWFQHAGDERGATSSVIDIIPTNLALPAISGTAR